MILRNGRREELTPNRLADVLHNHCANHPLTNGLIEVVTETVVTRVYDRGITQIPTKSLGRLVMELIREIDPFAYAYVVTYIPVDNLEELLCQHSGEVETKG